MASRGARALELMAAVTANVLLLAGLRRWQVTSRLQYGNATDVGTYVDGRPGTTMVEALAVLQDTMDSASRVGPTPRLALPELREHVARGGEVNCDGMAQLFVGALDELQIPNRAVTLRRRALDRWDAHTTVEVLIEGQWIVMDPTFHIRFEADGRSLSAAEVAANVWSSGTAAPAFLGDVRYPPRIDTYYLPWRQLFEHVYVEADRGRGGAWNLPPLRYLYGPRSIAIARPGSGAADAAAAIAYGAGVVAGPILVALSLMRFILPFGRRGPGR